LGARKACWLFAYDFWAMGNEACPSLLLDTTETDQSASSNLRLLLSPYQLLIRAQPF